MTSFFFWNVMKRDLRDLIARAVAERAVDVLILAEAGSYDADLVQALREATGDDYWAITQESDKVRIYSRLPVVRWSRRQTDNLNARMMVWGISVGKPPGVLLAVAHLVSRNNETPAGQAMLAVEVAKEISRVEDVAGHSRTVLVGDLNMNPFDEGITGAPALHAVMTQALAEREERTVQGRPYRFFYNPMWSLWGDRTAGPPGTYYHRNASVGDLFWHMLDQVLLRPVLMDTLTELEIVDAIDGESLLTERAGLPNSLRFSDHLPLAFCLQLD